MNLLIKYPSRGRPERFFQGMDSIYNNISDKINFRVLVTLDADDNTMNPQDVFEKIKAYKNTEIYYGLSNSKIEAVNRDMTLTTYPWDIVVVMSDDMRFTFFGFDEILRMEFDQYGLDTLLHVKDQDAKHHLATMYIAGRKFYDRFGYIYHHAYHSLFCDNEVQEVAQQLGKYKLCECDGLIAHLNPAYGHLERDAMFDEQQRIGWTIDQQTFNERKNRNFDLNINNHEI